MMKALKWNGTDSIFCWCTSHAYPPFIYFFCFLTSSDLHEIHSTVSYQEGPNDKILALRAVQSYMKEQKFRGFYNRDLCQNRSYSIDLQWSRQFRSSRSLLPASARLLHGVSQHSWQGKKKTPCVFGKSNKQESPYQVSAWNWWYIQFWNNNSHTTKWLPSSGIQNKKINK